MPNTTTARPAWLAERVNDPCGTPNRHPFWDAQPAERVGAWKLFERDGAWRAYDTRWNAWWQFPDREQAEAHAGEHPKGLDMWA